MATFACDQLKLELRDLAALRTSVGTAQREHVLRLVDYEVSKARLAPQGSQEPTILDSLELSAERVHALNRRRGPV